MFFAATGAVLDVVRPPPDDSWLAGWRARVERAAAQLAWTDMQFAVRRHAGGVLLAISAPSDQLFLATEINEWAVCATLAESDPTRRSLLEQALAEADPEALPVPVIEESAAFARICTMRQVAHYCPFRPHLPPAVKAEKE